MIVQFFVLRCDDCEKPSTDNPFDFSLSSHADARAEAKKRGWVRRKDHSYSAEQKDFCPQCKARH